MMTRRRFLQSTALFSGGGCATVLYTWLWEPHWFEINHRPLPITHLPETLRGARLVQLSDLHIGPQVDDAYLLRTFDAVKKLAPDFVVYTGDFISYEPGVFTHTTRVMPQLPLGRRGTFGILGNHDYGLWWSQAQVAEKVVELARSAGVKILRNEVAETDGLQIAGLDDLWAERFDLARALTALDPQKASLVLSHNPDTADQPGWGKYAGWILSGHTHGGQCKPPFLPPPLLPVRNRRYTAGEFALTGGRRLYINRGLGHILRVRFNVRPEVTVFHLQNSPQGAV